MTAARIIDPKSGSAGIELLEELSRVNNELADMHRELGRKNAALEEMNERLRLLGEEKNRFVGMASHDIRKPLAVIATFGEIVQQDAAGSLGPDHLEMIGIIRDTARSALAVVNDFLDVSRIEAGRFELETAPCDFAGCLRKSLRLNLHAAQKKDISLHWDDDGTPVACVCDEVKICQVLDNLISNAVKYSAPGSRIDILLEKPEGGLAVAVRDYGQGIATHEMKLLFQPFGRASVRATGSETSTGLGLAIAKKIVEAHGGRIWAESGGPGTGACFKFALPVKSSEFRAVS